MTSNNIVQFDNTKRKKNEFPSEDVLVVNETVGMMLQFLDERGYNIHNEKDIGLICEVINSALQRAENKKHSLQELADKIIIVT